MIIDIFFSFFFISYWQNKKINQKSPLSQYFLFKVIYSSSVIHCQFNYSTRFYEFRIRYFLSFLVHNPYFIICIIMYNNSYWFHFQWFSFIAFTFWLFILIKNIYYRTTRVFSVIHINKRVFLRVCRFLANKMVHQASVAARFSIS